MERLGLTLCTGCGIGDALDTEALEQLAGEAGCSTTVSHAALCSPEGLTAIRDAAQSENLDGLLNTIDDGNLIAALLFVLLHPCFELFRYFFVFRIKGLAVDFYDAPKHEVLRDIFRELFLEFFGALPGIRVLIE